jgi:hypothetical protein
LLCAIEEPGRFEVEIEQDVPRVQPGQLLTLKVRGLPVETFRATVERVAPRADPPPPSRARHPDWPAEYAAAWSCPAPWTEVTSTFGRP